MIDPSPYRYIPPPICCRSNYPPSLLVGQPVSGGEGALPDSVQRRGLKWTEDFSDIMKIRALFLKRFWLLAISAKARKKHECPTLFKRRYFYTNIVYTCFQTAKKKVTQHIYTDGTAQSAVAPSFCYPESFFSSKLFSYAVSFHGQSCVYIPNIRLFSAYIHIY